MSHYRKQKIKTGNQERSGKNANQASLSIRTNFSEGLQKRIKQCFYS